jgi:phosphoribosylpyrophosphate synthetase
MQLEYALENLDEVSRACGIGAGVDKGGGAARHFKIYVRHAEDQPQVAAMLQRELFTSGDSVSYLQADICRASLRVEERIEASSLEELVVTDTIPLHESSRACKKIRVGSVAGLLAEAIRRTHNEDSISSLFV